MACCRVTASAVLRERLQEGRCHRRIGFNLIWLPPSADAAGRNAGYNLRHYFNLTKS